MVAAPGASTRSVSVNRVYRVVGAYTAGVTRITCGNASSSQWVRERWFVRHLCRAPAEHQYWTAFPNSGTNPPCVSSLLQEGCSLFGNSCELAVISHGRIRGRVRWLMRM